MMELKTDISFEVSKLAKEKGFETHIAYFDKAYDKEGKRIPAFEIAQAPNKHKREGYQCVEQSVLQAWLREKHGVQVYVFSHTEKRRYGKNRKWDRKWGDFIAVWETTHLNDPRDGEYQTYEAALDFGLLEALKRL